MAGVCRIGDVEFAAPVKLRSPYFLRADQGYDGKFYHLSIIVLVARMVSLRP